MAGDSTHQARLEAIGGVAGGFRVVSEPHANITRVEHEAMPVTGSVRLPIWRLRGTVLHLGKG